MIKVRVVFIFKVLSTEAQSGGGDKLRCRKKKQKMKEGKVRRLTVESGSRAAEQRVDDPPLTSAPSTA